MLHGTGWDTVQAISSNGLDPGCGHASRGSWLGRNAESCHTYAAKGPGPEQEDRRRLFAIFAVACVPNHNEGDEERSFGVWRMMSRDRMCPAYLMIYSAPLDVRAKRVYPLPRMNHSAQLLQCRSHEDLNTADMKGSSSSNRHMNSSKSPNPRSHQRSVSPNRSTPSRSPSSPQRSCEEFGAAELRSSDSSNSFSPSPSQHVRRETCQGKSRSTRSPTRLGLGKKQNAQRSCEDLRKSEPNKLVPDRCSNSISQCGQSPSRAAQEPEPKQARPHCNGSTAWELQSDDGWVPFCPGVKFNDQPNTKQDLSYKHFWYRVAFDDTGSSGTQKNLSTGKIRRLRRVTCDSLSNCLEQV